MEQSKPIPETKKHCPEFPHFGAHYPDACCIDGYLWDLDKYEDGHLYGGGEDPCPFCNEQKYIEWAADDPNDAAEVAVIKKYIQRLREKYD